MSAKFDNIGGLKPKAAVKSAGAVVGRVESIVFDDKIFRARVPWRWTVATSSPKTARSKFHQRPVGQSNTSALRQVPQTRFWLRVTP